MVRILLVIPTLRKGLDLAIQAATIQKSRAGIDVDVHIEIDEKGDGWPAVHNRVFRKIGNEYDFYVFSCNDYFPGRDYLYKAWEHLVQNNHKLVSFNDGKWNGKIATVGIVDIHWAKQNYNGDLFFGGYSHHYADTEITEVAIADNAYGYCPEAVLIEVDYNKESSPVRHKDRVLFRKRNKGSEWT